MKITIALLAFLTALATLAVTTTAASQTKVFCAGDFPHTDRDVTRVRPEHCILQKRNAPDAEALYVRTKRMHWKGWSCGQAKRPTARDDALEGRIRELSSPVQRFLSGPGEHQRVRKPGW
jgi:hypothetical protein